MWVNFLYQENHKDHHKKFEEYFEDYRNNVVNHNCAGQGNRVFHIPCLSSILLTKRMYERWSSPKKLCTCPHTNTITQELGQFNVFHGLPHVSFS